MQENHSTPVSSSGPIELPLMTILDVERAVSLLTPTAPDALVLQLLELTAALRRRAAEIRQQVEALAVAWIEQNHQLVCGDVRYYAGHQKATFCVNQRQAVEALLAAVAGDLDQFCQLLVSQALKPGACRGVLPSEQYNDLFDSESKVVLKDGKPQKRLLTTNDAFNGRGRQSVTSEPGWPPEEEASHI